jgi:hypothetical protein
MVVSALQDNEIKQPAFVHSNTVYTSYLSKAAA